MENPLDAVKREIDAAGDAIELRVRIAVLEESALVALSRLTTLNPDTKRQSDYQAALAALSEK